MLVVVGGVVSCCCVVCCVRGVSLCVCVVPFSHAHPHNTPPGCQNQTEQMWGSPFGCAKGEAQQVWPRGQGGKGNPGCLGEGAIN